MSYDGVFTHAIISEIAPKIVNARISKIQQPYDDEIIISFRKDRTNVKLLASINPRMARLNLTKKEIINPKVPHNFVMVLRKYLEGTKLQSIEQYGNDRIIMFKANSYDELGDFNELNLVVEIMGNRSNIILVNSATGKIIDLIKRVAPDNNRFRTLLPGAQYMLPPQGEKINPFNDSSNTLLPIIASAIKNDVPVDDTAKLIQKKYQGLSFVSAMALVTYVSKGQKKANNSVTQKRINEFFEAFTNDHFPETFLNLQDKSDLAAIDYASIFQTKTLKHMDSLSSAVEFYFQQLTDADHKQQLTNNLQLKIKKLVTKKQKKIDKLNQSLKLADKAPQMERDGEILAANLYHLKDKVKSVQLPNFYNDNELVEIKMNSLYTPSDNVQRLFKKAKKLTNSISIIEKQIKIANQEINYLNSLQSQLEIADISDIAGIVDEINMSNIFDKRPVKSAKKIKTKNILNFHHFINPESGHEILVGRNNIQNDYLTHKYAHKNYLWFHVLGIPGSHVVINTSDPVESDIKLATNLAAYYSKARGGAKFPVDHTLIKYVHKPNGARPGYVIYDHQTTINADELDESFIENLKEQA